MRNKQKESWWINHNGKQIRLGKTREEAEIAWHKLASGDISKATPDTKTVGYIIDEFLLRSSQPTATARSTT